MELQTYLLYLNSILTSSIYMQWYVYNLEGLIEYEKQQFHNEMQRVCYAVDIVHVLVNRCMYKN